MQKNKISYIASIITALFIILSILPLASAVTTLNTPAASSTIGGASVTFNVTTTDLTDTRVNLVNVTFYASSTLTANSSWSILGRNNSVNLTVTANMTVGVFSVAYAILEDANNYILNVTIINSTGGQFIGADTNTGVIVDNTIPQAASSLSPATGTTDADGSVAFSGTVTGRNTTSCTLRFPDKNPGTTSYSMTHSGSTCSLTLSNVPEQSFRWFIRASDETNTTDSSTIDLRIDKKTGAGTAAQYLAGNIPSSETGRKTLSIINTDGSIAGWAIIVGVVVVIFVIYFIAKKK